MKRLTLVAVAVLLTMPTLLVAPVAAEKQPAIRNPTVDCSAGTSCLIQWNGATEVDVSMGTSVDRIDQPGGAVRGAPHINVPDLDPAKRYYFRLVPAGAKRGVVVADRSLHLESAPNARDIGGYATKDGHHVQWGRVYRSDEISKATDADSAKIAGLGIKLVCDFRSPSEVESRGADKLPPGAELLSAPVLGENDTTAAEIEDAITSGDHVAQQRLLGNGKAAKLLVDGGTFFVTDKTARKQFGAVLQRLADPASLPAFTHCTAGKDRTGWSTAVILTALGVPKKTVIADYLLTNDFVAEKNTKTLEAIKALGSLPELVRPLLEVRPEYIRASFDAVRKEYGSFATYLRKGLGLDARTLAQLKKNLLTD